MIVNSPSDNLISDGFVTDEGTQQWLKSLLPEAASGWWDVYMRGNGFAIRFCWRDHGTQKLTFPRISLNQFRTFSLIGEDEVRDELRAKIVEHLRSLLPDPAKCGKALAVVERLRIDLESQSMNESPA
jgi:hypothetical protein